MTKIHYYHLPFNARIVHRSNLSWTDDVAGPARLFVAIESHHIA